MTGGGIAGGLNRANKQRVRPGWVNASEPFLAYCLGDGGLRLTAAWASAVRLADLSNPALLYRLRRCGPWLRHLIGLVLAANVPRATAGRPIRLIDATTVPKAGREAKRRNGLWRIHSVFELATGRFGQFVLTDEHGAEQLDRIAVVRDEIRIADRVHVRASACIRGSLIASNAPADGPEARWQAAKRRCPCRTFFEPQTHAMMTGGWRERFAFTRRVWHCPSVAT